jgi:hypothetical protein
MATAKTSAAIFKFRNMTSSRRDSSDQFLVLVPGILADGMPSSSTDAACRANKFVLHGNRQHNLTRVLPTTFPLPAG